MSYIEIHAHTRSELYSIIPNHIINATYLQLDAKGLMAWMLSKQHLKKAWSLSLKSISTQLNTGLSKIKRIVKELQESDHLRIQRLATGQTVWHVYEEQNDCKRDRGFKKPQVDNQLKAPYIQEKPQVEKPHVENQPVLQSNDLIQSNIKRTTTTASPKILNSEQIKTKIAEQEWIDTASNIHSDNLQDEWLNFIRHNLESELIEPKWLNFWSRWNMNYQPPVKPERKMKRFTPPTVAEVYAYMTERGLNNKDEAEAYCDFYQSKGWLVGKAKMKDWKAAVRTWISRNKKDQPQQAAHKPRMFGEA